MPAGHRLLQQTCTAEELDGSRETNPDFLARLQHLDMTIMAYAMPAIDKLIRSDDGRMEFERGALRVER